MTPSKKNPNLSTEAALPYQMFEIQQNLYLSRFPRVIPEEVTHVLNMCTEPHPKDPKISYMQVPIYDFDNITPYIKDICQFIDTAIDEGGIVLVHCAMGVNRSVAAVISYLCHRKSINSFEALTVVKNIKFDVNPSTVILRQIDLFYKRSEGNDDPLLNFHRRLQARKANAGIVDRGLIEHQR